MILTLNSGSAHGSPMMGGTGPADAATDTLVRNLAIELGPRGVRAVGLWAAGVPVQRGEAEGRRTRTWTSTGSWSISRDCA